MEQQQVIIVSLGTAPTQPQSNNSRQDKQNFSDQVPSWGVNFSCRYRGNDEKLSRKQNFKNDHNIKFLLLLRKWDSVRCEIRIRVGIMHYLLYHETLYTGLSCQSDKFECNHQIDWMKFKIESLSYLRDLQNISAFHRSKLHLPLSPIFCMSILRLPMPHA